MKISLKKMLAVFLVALMCVSGITSLAYIVDPSSQKKKTNTQVHIPDPMAETYEAVITSVVALVPAEKRKDDAVSDRDKVFPEAFAGMFEEDGKFVMNVVPNASDNSSKAVVDIAKKHDIEVREVQFSLNQLNQTMDMLYPYTAVESGLDIFSVEGSIRKNRVFIPVYKISDEKIAKIEEAVGKNPIIVFENSEELRPPEDSTPIEPVIEAGPPLEEMTVEKAVATATITPGIKIYTRRVNSDGSVSAPRGSSATAASRWVNGTQYAGFLISGHITYTTTNVYISNSSSAQPIGTIFGIHNGGNCDAAFVDLNVGYEATTGNMTGEQHVNSNTWEGRTVTLYGSESYNQSGTIENFSVSLLPMSDMVTAWYSSTNGDSGAAVAWGSNLVGIHKGKYSTSTGLSWFSKIQNVNSRLGTTFGY